MSRPLLLIVDGESIRTSGLVSTLEKEGWGLQWVRSADAAAFPETLSVPDLLLLDADAGGFSVVRKLRARKPELPVLALAAASGPGGPAKGHGVEVQGFLDRAQSEAALVAALRPFLQEPPKLTTDDIFGDLLADLEGTSVPAASFSRFTQSGVAPAALPPVPVQDLPPQEELFALSTPERANLPLPSVKVVPAQKIDSQAPVAAEPLGPTEFTLSGISGVKDPFEWASPQPEPVPAPVAPPVPRLDSKGVPEIMEEYGNYFLLEKIAVGGMAELFKAQQRGVQGFQKIVAIKRILPHFSDNEDFVTMFIDEAKLAAQLTHPNIVQIFDLGKAGNSYYIAMEYVNGRDLRTLLKKVREYGLPIPEQVAAFVVMKVAAALDYAHRKRGFDDRELKLVHRDISPQNVILSTEGAVKLVDFGIAKAASKASHTVAGALKGKLLYMSPEQATGQPLDNRSDLYSLGLVLFELLTGERCFQADSELGVLEKVRLGRISDLTSLNPNVSKEIAAIVSRALQKSVDHRYPSARFLERDLRDYLQRQGTPITEHDVADYMNTLLKGTQEQLETLISTKFPAATNLASGAHRVPMDLSPQASVDQAANTATHREPSYFQDRAVTEGSVDLSLADKPQRPRWLLPVILSLAVILVIMLILAAWS
ncbi:protein kinase [Geothrix sp. PMB-07]|uniref:protein kinase domain-containing protein n=1 Tax=Geothrix sp. PMB-07 TaxID=3068640 RepID=UPI002740B4D3|nr:protein kinase [Geothrix sp. PMB-07]WLT30461.1 protein kinase [Geothrix sp. PMB-07]